MKPIHYRSFSILIAIFAIVFSTMLYTAKPRTVEEALIKTSVATGLYQVDRQAFERGVEQFRRDEFVTARDSFAAADPKQQDAEVQFYVAYSYYREGWGRLSNDDDLFRKGIAAATLAGSIDPEFRSPDASLQMRTIPELRSELEQGIVWSLSDLDPRRLTRERK